MLTADTSLLKEFFSNLLVLSYAKRATTARFYPKYRFRRE
jgi:hypothetical protein